ncbi:hydroxyectoine utilization dehydratase EutB [Marivibrio halodurans]|uniref:Hydroxyectoine utilization dehydratase EutB n=1 Tax=Marivibrio halodurans TaxID=2039722 RepID=A0A8J7SNB4_9PROT|nr:hydroxyectoine utilization dehydratase EutB [Marivibrio halodurans]MBP5857913.1 hydroxyectoine utilization dehydratase EutB [Marivibrio halodurans]
MEPVVTLPDIEAARTRIEGHVIRTPLVPSPSLSAVTGADVRLKLDLLQPSGAFKLRGATNALLSLSPADRARGVTCCSTGNHGRAVAYAAGRLGIRAVICMSRLVPANKVRAIEALGAEARIVGRSQDEAAVEAGRLVAEEGMVMIPPFDHRDVVAGQGTCGLEIVEDWPEVDTVIVPLSGGGLIAGVAAAVKARRPAARIVGVSMDRGAAMQASLAAGHPVAVEEVASLADSLGGGIGLDNRITFAMCRALVDEVILVDEAAIARAMRHLYRAEQLVAEGGAAVGAAALLERSVTRPGGHIAVIVTGRGVDMDLFTRIASGEDVDPAAVSG